MNTGRQHKRIQGFSLIELTIVLTVAALLIAGAANLFHTYLMAERNDEQTETMSDIQSAMITFFATDSDDPANGIIEQRYPCPADPSIAPGEEGYGVEQRAADGTGCLETGAIVRVNNGDGTGDVYIGAVPFATLGISSESSLDAFDNQLTYAITEALTVEGVLASSPVPQGEILVTQEDPDTGAETTSSQPFVVVSHGLTGAGAFTAQGVPNAAGCPADTSDAANCDDTDARFRSFLRSEGDNEEFFDDELVFSLIGADADADDLNQLWLISPTNTNNILNRNSGNVGIGTSEPVSTLDVAGTIKVSEIAGLACDATIEGAIRYNLEDDEMEFCDGTRWRVFGGTRVASGIADDGAVINLADHGFDPDGPNPHVIVSARDHHKDSLDGNTEDASICAFEMTDKLTFSVNCKASTNSDSGFNAPSKANWMAAQTPSATFGEPSVAAAGAGGEGAEGPREVEFSCSSWVRRRNAGFAHQQFGRGKSEATCQALSLDFAEANFTDLEVGDQISLQRHTNGDCHGVVRGNSPGPLAGCSGCRAAVCTVLSVTGG